MNKSIDPAAATFGMHAVMIKKCMGLTVVMTVLCLGACSKNRSERDSIPERPYDTESLREVSAVCGIDSLPEIIDMEDIFVWDKNLVVVSDIDTFAFHRYSLSDFSFIDKFGKRGEGPGEITEPSPLMPSGSGFYVIDNGKHRMYSMTENSDTVHFGFDMMNMAREVALPYIGYYRMNGSGRELCLFDMGTKAVTDSLSIAGVFPDLDNTPFFWSTNSRKVVLVFNTIDAVAVFDVEAGKFTNGVSGRGGLEDGGYAFSGVECLDNCFIAISNRDIDSGGSELIVFDYDCTPKLKIKTDRIGRRIVYDKYRHRILMTGQSDDYIYTVDLPEL